MTVSRALREGTFVEARLRARIKEAAHRIGYQRDSRISEVMSAIRKSRHPQYRETLAIVWLHRPDESGVLAGAYEEMLSGARSHAEQLGYKIDEFHLGREEMSGRALSRILYARGIRGVMVAPPGAERPFPRVWLDWKNFCAVLIGRSLVNRGLPRVLPDYAYSCRLTLRRLRRLRYRRPGLAVLPAFDLETGHLVRATFQGQHPLGARAAGRLVFDEQESNFGEWVVQARPDVVILHDEGGVSPECLAQLRRARVDCVVLNWNRHQPATAGVNLQWPLIGQNAVDLLLARLRQNRLGLDETAPIVQVPGVWSEGVSLAKPASSEVPANIIPMPARKTATRAARAKAVLA
jgi:LacI family transcriptional regulator